MWHKKVLLGLANLVCVSVLVLAGGCQLIGLIAVAGSPTKSEQVQPAEYNLAQVYELRKKEKVETAVLVLVDQPAHIRPGIDLRYQITRSIDGYLVNRLEIDSEDIVGYSRLSEFRMSHPDYYAMTPAQIGRTLDADFVLYVTIDEYSAQEEGEGYYKGALGARAMLIEAGSGTTIWPRDTDARKVTVGFEMGRGGTEATALRLARALAHCTTRYLYDCPQRSFKIAEDRGGSSWTQWQ